MNRRIGVVATLVVSALAFTGGAMLYSGTAEGEPTKKVVAGPVDSLIRPHSPIIGPKNAPVTIVEFFDPSCEACRAFYPTVKGIVAKYPKDVRLVMRYLPLHPGSAEAIVILEAAASMSRRRARCRQPMRWPGWSRTSPTRVRSASGARRPSSSMARCSSSRAPNRSRPESRPPSRQRANEGRTRPASSTRGGCPPSVATLSLPPSACRMETPGHRPIGSIGANIHSAFKHEGGF